MSFFMGNKSADGNPLLHMTSDTKTPAQMDSDPVATTVFHSDLPYIFIRDRFVISSYSSYYSGHGRKFIFPQALIDYKTANPDIAHLLILEDASGNRWIHDPLTVCMSWDRPSYYNGYHTVPRFEVSAALNGGTYQAAYTDSDTQLDYLARNPWYPSSTGFSFTFRTWDTNDTSVTIFKTPKRDCNSYNQSTNPLGNLSYSYNWDDAVHRYMTLEEVAHGTQLRSSGLDVVKVEIVFLNITHSVSTFERQHDFSASDIKITPDAFTINAVDLLDFVPVLSHGPHSVSDTMTPITTGGDVLCGKSIGVNLNDSKISSSNQLLVGDASVIELPPEAAGSDGWEIDFDTQTITRSGEVIFDSTWAARSLFVAGYKEIDFGFDLTLHNYSVSETLSSTQTGSFTGVDANTIYLASVVVNNQSLCSTSLMGVGDNVITWMSLGSKSPWQWASVIKLYLNITSGGVCSVKCDHAPGTNVFTSWAGSYFDIEFWPVSIRLIALKYNT